MSKLGCSPKWVEWVSSLYWLASSSIKVNGEFGEDFKLSRLVKHGCPLAPYLFILVTDILDMLDGIKYNVEGLTLPKGGCVRDQTFVDDTAFYLKGTKSNMDIMQSALDLFVSHPGHKSNGGSLLPFGSPKISEHGNGVKRLGSSGSLRAKGSLLGHPSWIPAPREGKLQ
jgi:hypothetical protein